MLSTELGGDMRPREIIRLLAGAAVTWPVSVRAQQPVIPVVGFLHSSSQQGYGPINASVFPEGLPAGGFTAGRDVA